MTHFFDLMQSVCACGHPHPSRRPLEGKREHMEFVWACQECSNKGYEEVLAGLGIVPERREERREGECQLCQVITPDGINSYMGIYFLCKSCTATRFDPVFDSLFQSRFMRAPNEPEMAAAHALDKAAV